MALDTVQILERQSRCWTSRLVINNFYFEFPSICEEIDAMKTVAHYLRSAASDLSV